MEYGDLSRDAVIERLTVATRHDRLLDGFVWLHVGCDYPPTKRGFEPWGPANPVNGRTMATAYRLGLTGVEGAFSVPPLTSDLGAACLLAEMWFPSSSYDIRSGAVRLIHRCDFTTRPGNTFTGNSRLSGAAAVCAALLLATRTEQPLPGNVTVSPENH